MKVLLSALETDTYMSLCHTVSRCNGTEQTADEEAPAAAVATEDMVGS